MQEYKAIMCDVFNSKHLKSMRVNKSELQFLFPPSNETMAWNIWIIVVIEHSFFFFFFRLVVSCRSYTAVRDHPVQYLCIALPVRTRDPTSFPAFNFNSSTVHFTSVHFLRSRVVSHLIAWKSESAGEVIDAEIFSALAVPVSSMIHAHGVSPFTNQCVVFLTVHLNH